VLKHSAPAELVDAIRAALDGKTYLTPVLGGVAVLARTETAPPAGEIALDVMRACA
jgi:DNA-binding NarL/FixJ family response regulator